MPEDLEGMELWLQGLLFAPSSSSANRSSATAAPSTSSTLGLSSKAEGLRSSVSGVEQAS
eukprot:CAMPEP_0184301118 /NCGR_PEP_ID=MMETSP1049-20130417/11354_1 /TAXON_ID=77928 /ORGANISM="Proteomonas sulcata, Strain CCMP704" /LENGTH=59 /DNA_ID=CAMNT_0026612021 /DNA_START=617 /DNA_END=797 /DNA_ORIENTATION=-